MDRPAAELTVEQIASSVPDVTVFRLSGPFTMSTMFAFQSELREPSVKGTIIDLSGVPFIDSAALGVLLAQFAHAQRNGFRFALTGMAPRVHTIFEITHTDTILPIFPTQADAEQSLAAAAK